ncbi:MULTISPECIES: ATP-grasp fold amidoligase family protein [Clostridia]|uniref:Glycosyl transferase n=2 Tax=Clostridia TaxID=186801 RepID=A0A8I0A315_9CLOT|nr:MULTISPECIES: ATP-grasp fold amidoligase family protein [Clostridia]MBC5638998.1 glycosyl transferase [Clostridium lentum]MBC5653091.1 glycosyl transferase [Blautia lenta]OKZ87662.1 MAG: hypothetical protein BHW04_04520 [Clostridium sp. 29_15]
MKNKRVRRLVKFVWRRITPIIYNISPVFSSKILFRISTGKKLNLKEPKTFNEKLMWLKLYDNNELVVKCADKYEVRKYVEDLGYKNLLPKLYGIYEQSEDIEWSKFPKKFAIKCTHGCGFNIICDDKSKLNINEANEKLKKWLKTRYVFEALESQYDKMIPRIICEEYIETKDGVLPNDYKIYCFNGKPKLTLVCTERAKEVKMKFMDLKWKEMNIGNPDFLSDEYPNKPECYDEMLKIAERLSKPFPFVRVDFYDLNGKPILGEMTFTPAGCAARYYNENGLNMLGSMIKLSEK